MLSTRPRKNEKPKNTGSGVCEPRVEGSMLKILRSAPSSCDWPQATHRTTLTSPQAPPQSVPQHFGRSPAGSALVSPNDPTRRPVRRPAPTQCGSTLSKPLQRPTESTSKASHRNHQSCSTLPTDATRVQHHAWCGSESRRSSCKLSTSSGLGDGQRTWSAEWSWKR